MKHDLAMHVAAGSFGKPTLGCEACEEDMLEEGFEVVHIKKEDGSCVISLNGQGHLPCARHSE